MKRIIILCFSLCFYSAVFGEKQSVKFDKDTISILPCQQGEMISTLFTFTNKDKDTLSIISATGSCKCIITEFKKGKIPPGGCGYILCHFNSKTEFGKYFKTIVLATTKGLFTAAIQGEIVSRERPLNNLSFSKKVYNAGIIKAGTAKDYVIKFRNPTTVPVFIKGIEVKGTPFDIEYDARVECAGKEKKYYKKIIGIYEDGEIVVHINNKKGKLHGPRTTKLIIWANLFDGPLVLTVKSDFE